MFIKRLLRRFGFDVRRHHPLRETLLRHHRIGTVLDIGANDGHFSREMREAYPDAQIYAFEPLKDCFDRMTSLFEGDTRFKAFNIALGESDGSAEIGRSSFHPSSSLRKMSQLHKDLYPKSADASVEQISVRRLDGLAAEFSLEGSVLVKMDVQGFEDKVILGGRNTLAEADVIIAETAFVRLYEDQPLFGDIHDLLRSLGFSYRGNCAEHFSRLTGERIYEDSVFVRN